MPYHSRLLPDMIILPGQPIPKTLIINFDETMVHSEYHMGQGLINYKRPHLIKFLEELSNVYEIVIFSSLLDSHVKYKINFFKILSKNSLFNLFAKKSINTIPTLDTF